MQDVYDALLALQELDRAIEAAEARVAAFGPELERLEEPAAALEREIEALRARLAEMKQESRRLERAATEKRERLERYRSRLERVRTAREEAAAQTEYDLVRRAVEADEQEALQLMEQTVRTELKLDELERELAKVRAAIEPRRQELLAARRAAEEELAVLRERRHNQAIRLDPAALRLYERVRSGRTRVVVAALTPDGACG